MPFSKGHKKAGGRVAGTPNKTTAALKEILTSAIEEIGGRKRLVEWIREDPAHEYAFWTNMAMKLMPVQIAGDKDNPVQHIQKIEVEIVRSPNADK